MMDKKPTEYLVRKKHLDKYILLLLNLFSIVNLVSIFFISYDNTFSKIAMFIAMSLIWFAAGISLGRTMALHGYEQAKEKLEKAEQERLNQVLSLNNYRLTEHEDDVEYGVEVYKNETRYRSN